MTIVGTGCGISPFDGRDLIFKPEEIGLEPAPSKNKVRLKLPWQPIDQGEVPCCVSIAVVTCMEILDVQKPPTVQLSVLFHYYITPKDQRTGELNLSEAFYTAAKKGVCPLEFHDHPITHEGAKIEPTLEARTKAEKFCLVGYDPRRRRKRFYRIDVDKIEDWRAALFAGRGVAFAFYLTGGYFDIQENGNVHGDVKGKPSINSSLHAVVAVGYDDTKKALLIRDSQGGEKFDKGHWWLPYSLVEHPRFIAEAFTAEEITYNE